VWVRSWLSRSERRAKLRPQPGTRQACGFSPVCTRVCTSMSALRRKARPQTPQRKVVVPLWMLRWRLRLPLSWNSRAQPGKQQRNTCAPAAVITGRSASASAVGDSGTTLMLTGFASTSEDGGDGAVVAGDAGTEVSTRTLGPAAATVGDRAAASAAAAAAEKPGKGCILFLMRTQ